MSRVGVNGSFCAEAAQQRFIGKVVEEELLLVARSYGLVYRLGV